MTRYTFNLDGRSGTSFKFVGNEIAKVIKAMKPFMKAFVKKYGQGYPHKSWIYLDFDPMAREFYIGNGDWIITLSTDEEQDAEMELKTTDYRCGVFDDELDFICAIRDHRHEFVNKINETLNK